MVATSVPFGRRLLASTYLIALLCLTSYAQFQPDERLVNANARQTSTVVDLESGVHRDVAWDGPSIEAVQRLFDVDDDEENEKHTFTVPSLSLSPPSWRSKRSLPDLYPDWYYETNPRPTPPSSKYRPPPSRYRRAVSEDEGDSSSSGERLDIASIDDKDTSTSLAKLTPNAAPKTHSPNHLHCSFTLASHTFNLCSLFEPKSKPFVWRKEEVTPPTVSETVYYLGLGGALDSVKGEGSDKCPEGTWVCMIKTNKFPTDSSSLRTTHIVPIAGNPVLEEGHSREKHPGLNVTARMVKWGNKEDSPQHLAITLHGGKWANQTQAAWIVFRCNEDAGDTTAPEFLWTYKGSHAFMWTSPAACPTTSDSDSDTPAPPRHSHTATRTATPGTSPTGAPASGGDADGDGGGQDGDGVPDPGDLPTGDDSENSGSGENGVEGDGEEKKDFTVPDPRYPGGLEGKIGFKMGAGLLGGAIVILLAIGYLLRASHHGHGYNLNSSTMNERFGALVGSLKNFNLKGIQSSRNGYSRLSDPSLGEDGDLGGANRGGGGSGGSGLIGSVRSFVGGAASNLAGLAGYGGGYGRSRSGRSRYGSLYRPFPMGPGRGRGRGGWRVGERKLASWVEEEEVDLGEYADDLATRGGGANVNAKSNLTTSAKSSFSKSSPTRNAPRPGTVQVLFDSYVNDNDLDGDLAGDGGGVASEEMPLAPSPGRFGAGLGYGHQSGGGDQGDVEGETGIGGRERGWVGYGGYGSVTRK